MNDILQDWPPKAFIYMKVGPHGFDSLDDILARKEDELRASGRIFWGYGGSTCHPRTQVRPFCDEWTAGHGPVYLLMDRLPKPRRYRIPNTNTAIRYSEDGKNWERLPEGVQTGPAFALTIGEIVPVEREIDLRHYRVGVGRNRGRSAADYIKWRVDKGCLVPTETPPAADVPAMPATIAYAAEVLPPYGVFLRHE